MSTVVVSEMPMRVMVRRLRAFEGDRCLWRPVAAAATFVVALALPVAGAIAAALLTAVGISQGSVLQAAVGAVITGCAGGLANYMRKVRPWRKGVADRLWTWERPNPTLTVEVLISEADLDAAKDAIRRARLNPTDNSGALGAPPPDAPTLTRHFTVYEPDAWARSKSDAERLRRVLDALHAANVTARANGVDVSAAR